MHVKSGQREAALVWLAVFEGDVNSNFWWEMIIKLNPLQYPHSSSFLKGNPHLQWKSGITREVASLEWDNLVLF